MRCILLLIDGLADVTQSALDGHTPLETAVTPALDEAARNGRVGTIAPLNTGSPSSLPNLLALLGYPSGRAASARGWFEALGLGLSIAPNEWAWRLQFVTLSDGRIVDPSPAALRAEETGELLSALGAALQPLGWRLVEGAANSHLAISAHDFTGVETTSPWDAQDKDLKSVLPRGRHAGPLASLIEKAQAVLEGHEINRVRLDLRENPANAAWPWGGGTHIKLTPFHEIHSLDGVLASSSPLARGVSIAAGLRLAGDPGFVLPLKDPSGRFAAPMTAPAKPSATRPEKSSAKSSADSARPEFQSLLGVAKAEMEGSSPVILLHSSAVADAGMSGGPLAKRAAIEMLDEELIAPLMALLAGKDARLAVVSTVGLDSGRRVNLGGPSPLCVWGNGVSAREHVTLTEKNVEKAGMKVSQPQQFIEYVLGGL